MMSEHVSVTVCEIDTCTEHEVPTPSPRKTWLLAGSSTPASSTQSVTGPCGQSSNVGPFVSNTLITCV